MAEIINLRRVRKRRERETREQIAAEQRLRFGRPKVERRADAAREELRERTLDGHKRVREDEK
jgi:hypothetical protein